MLLSLATILGTTLMQRRSVRLRIDDLVRRQAASEASKIAHNAYLICAGVEARNQRDLDRSFGLTRDLVTQAGGLHLSAETVAWQAVNQLTKTTVAATLPRILLGTRWLGQITADAETVPVVDEVRRLTGDYCTLFQRMNDAGDMLRVATSLRKPDGTRAIGTFIPAHGANGEANPVIAAVLRGETYRGRAFVVDDWFATVYAPVWDDAHRTVIGMTFVGLPLGEINRELRDAIVRMSVGKSGYVFVLGAHGDQRGHYLISAGGKRDGEDVWEWDPLESTCRHASLSIL